MRERDAAIGWGRRMRRIQSSAHTEVHSYGGGAWIGRDPGAHITTHRPFSCCWSYVFAIEFKRVSDSLD